MKDTQKIFMLYKVTSPSNKVYIGITCESLRSRKSKHKYTANRMKKSHKFSNAIKKYGIDGMNWEIVCSNLTKEDAINKEIVMIKELDTYKSGYNSTKGGEGAWGYKWSKEDIEKYLKIRTEKYYTNDEWLKKQSEITKNFYKNNPEFALKRAKECTERPKLTRHKFEKRRIESIRKPEAKMKMVKSKGCKEFNVYCISKRKYIGTWLLKTECAKELNIHSSKISSCLNKQRRQTGGYIFKHKDEVDGLNIKDHWFDKLRRNLNEKDRKRENG